MKTIYYRVPDYCEDSWFPLDTFADLSKDYSRDSIAQKVANLYYACDTERLQGWLDESPLRFDFAEEEYGPILFSRMVSASSDISFRVREVPDAESPE